MAEKNIVINVKTSSGYDQLYPKTKSDIVDFDNSNSNIIASNVEDAIKEINNKIYPVGSIYMSVNDTNPSLLFGGTWERFSQGKVIVGVDEDDSDFNSSKKSGGSKSINLAHTHTVNSHTHTTASHTLTASEMPKHTHSFSATTGSSGSHSHTMLSNHHTVYWGQSGSATHLANSNVVGGSFSTPGQNTLYMNPSEQGTNSGGSHTHSVSGTTGSSGSGAGHSHGNTGSASPETNSQLSSSQSILQPYVTCYIWLRTA